MTIHSSEIFAEGKQLILAPMVRVTTLPFRLLCLEYGADLAYSEEIVDHKMLCCRRIVNGMLRIHFIFIRYESGFADLDALNTIDFSLPGERYPIFRTCDEERDKVVFQMGTSDPERAVQVAKLIEADVAAIDINMGCPKDFSVLGGMGCALLQDPLKIAKLDSTLEVCKLIERCGASALAVHGRTRTDRPDSNNRNSDISTICRMLNIPVIANGGSNDISDYQSMENFRNQTGCEKLMIARAAKRNPSIFSASGLMDLNRIVCDYLKYVSGFSNVAVAIIDWFIFVALSHP
ncbi:unnamed protein product [Soboliphyme baturini]|uniref:tRNA-dihydrouridine synthase n=1 Tax=Soboliphyme baturini TaxID=241478 RepID=A0A183IDD5_9BILA|nr:unnamed protein product [Soboliphyme baturini]